MLHRAFALRVPVDSAYEGEEKRRGQLGWLPAWPSGTVAIAKADRGATKTAVSTESTVGRQFVMGFFGGSRVRGGRGL